MKYLHLKLSSYFDVQCMCSARIQVYSFVNPYQLVITCRCAYNIATALYE